MKIKGRDSDAWHKNINDTAGPRRPTDADFPWIALQNHTGYYLKKKGKLSQAQVDERLLTLIKKHPSKEAAVAACADRLSAQAVKAWLINDSRVEPGGALGTEEVLQIIIAINHVNSGAVSQIEAKWAHCLLEHAAAGGSSRSPAQQLHDVLCLLPTQVAPDILLHEDIKRLADVLCMEFAKQLRELAHRSQWTDAHAAVEWLSTASTRLQVMNAESGTLLDRHLPKWGAWAAWRPHVPRLRAWKRFTTFARSFLEDVLALEGPDFASMIGSEQATLRQGLIAQCSRTYQSTLQWGKTHASFRRNPYIDLENLNGILERLTSAVDYACSAGPEYTALLAHLCSVKIMNNEVLQILEGVQILDRPPITTAILQFLTSLRQDVVREALGIRQLMPALGDSRIFGLRQQMQPRLVERISKCVKELQGTLFMQFGVGGEWLDAATELLLFTQALQEQAWLLAELDPPVQQLVASAPSLLMTETLGAVRKSVRTTPTSAPTPLVSQIDAYYKAQFTPSYAVDSQAHGLVEALINVWHRDSDTNHRELALVIADLPKFGSQFRCDCLIDITTVSGHWITSTLEALKFDNGNPDLGCTALIGLLASEHRTAIRERWGTVLAFAIEKQHDTFLHHAMTNLTTDTWLELLSAIRVVYRGSEVIKEHRSPRLLSLELHTWSQQMADYLPTLTRLENVLEHGPAMQVLLLGPAALGGNQLLRVLGHVKDSKSSYHAKVMDHIIAFLRGGNADEIEDALSVVSKARSKGAEACLRVLELRGQVHPELAEVALAIMLRAGDLSEPDRLALRKVAKLYGITVDAEDSPSAAGLNVAANFVYERYLRLITEAQRLENLRLSLQAVAPKSVSKLLVRLDIKTPSVVDDALAILPSSLGSLVGKVSESELELQFPATKLTKLQRFAIGAGDAESFLIRLTLRQDRAPIKFCIHLSGESSNRTKSKTSSNIRSHTPWEVFRSSSRPPYEQYCRGRPNLGTYQLSRILWYHLRHDFRSLEHTHEYITTKLSRFGQGCAVCGVGQRRLRRATICSSPSCRITFAKAPLEIQLAEIWQDPPVMDLLLSMTRATASTGKLDLLIDFPVNNAPAVVGILDGLPAIPALAKHLEACLDVHGNQFRLAQALEGYCNQSSDSESLANALLWLYRPYRGFLVSATGLQRIPSFGKNQFLLANAAPDLEIAFSRHMPTSQSTSQLLFHGTSLDRLHAILCQGLRVQSGTNLQRHGAFHGAGIYMADEPTVAWGYATASVGGWKSSKLRSMKLLLGCELAGPKPQAAYRGIHVITDATRLAVRYVFLLGSEARMPAAKDVKIAMESVFRGLRNNTL